jgi:hypothetical protein
MSVADDQQAGGDDDGHGIRYTGETLLDAAPAASLRWGRSGGSAIQSGPFG